MEVYLDNSATTKITEGVRDTMLAAMYEDYGNPSSMHRLGMRAEQYIKEAAGIIASNLKVEPKEIIFTSGGTEANNLALIGTALANKRRGTHIITSRIEHPSIHQPLVYLEENGFEISFAPVDASGKLIKEALYELIKENTLMVSLMYVNNEIGSVQDIAEIASELKKRKKDVIFHVDAVQAYGKYRIYPKREGIDLLSFSGHKIHGPKGIGALYVSDKVRINPIVFGGGHQRGLRSGTENVSGIAGLGQAVAELYENHEAKVARMYQLKQKFLREVSTLEGITVNGIPEECMMDFELEHLRKTAPHIMSISFHGVRSEVFLHALEDKGIYVSSGSACSSHHPTPSVTLSAIGLPKDLLDSTLRFSMSEMTTEEEIDYTLEKIKELLPMLRRYTRKK
ncbi:cysteine desulfurase [Lachnospiraceae bacterium MD1]|jgi:cysteine desulfurase|uniref:cysteine desulfurase n=1 Tax=Variimorphobacter saccharofermentans TaxID=2755051 RepID=A0A839JZ56_9FIRM|nr:cysteine desulfurase family protein [Variimorphobacter saccharofermentans]MBB2182497.1 cysteine desulfurase [Variimorphobacter saccharofermentans]